MSPRNYSYQLRTLRAVERQLGKDMTEPAMQVFYLRMQDIDESSEDEDAKTRQREAAMRQWDGFMQRPMKANG